MDLFIIIIISIINIKERTGMKNIIIALVFIVSSLIFVVEIDRLYKQNAALKSNQKTLLEQYDLKVKEAQRYKVQDSLNAATIKALSLSVDDYKKTHAEDYKLIKQLRHSKSELNNVIAANLQTTDTINLPTIIIEHDSATTHCFDYKSKWLDLNGCLDLTSDSIELSITNREALKVVETVTYKRFLGFLWKTSKVKSRQIDIISENPATQIINTEFISISN